jgi:ABC-type dipeptide/oligopeptide/nickel transport system permease component
MTDEQVEVWLRDQGYLRPWAERYVEWLGGVVRGDLGTVDAVPRAGRRGAGAAAVADRAC